MAYVFVREITFKTLADGARAAPLLSQIVKLYKEALDVEVSVARAISGAPNRVCFVSRVDSLDKWQADAAKIQKDPAFLKVLGEIGPMVDGSKTRDDLWAEA